MKIAIHHNEKSQDFSPKWIEYCERRSIAYKVVNAYDNDIIEQVSDCDGFLWHFSHINYKDMLFAKQLLFALEMAGKKVFPDFRTAWHFDDKVGQKYLLEAIGAPLIPSYVFYNQQEAQKWINEVAFPKVFKLRGGSGAVNVQLVRNRQEASRLVRKAFGKGFPQYNSWESLRERWRKYRQGQTDFKDVLKGIARFVYKTDFAQMRPNEKGYVLFQDFIPGNNFDTRVVVIGGKRALCEQRFCREGDFRASGSGNFKYGEVPPEILEVAFRVAQELKLQSVAFDFILQEKKPLIVEMSYGFGAKGLAHCPGYYSADLKWHAEPEPFFWGWMVEELLASGTEG